MSSSAASPSTGADARRGEAEDLGGTRRGPLSNIRVLELSQLMVGPSCGLALSYLGAEVIRLESLQHLDRFRLTGVAVAEGEHAYDQAPTWSEWNAGKLGIQVNLKHPDGVDLAKQLLATCDVFFYNMRQSAIDKLGLDYKTLLAEVNPQLIVMCLSGSGGTGPERDYVGYAPTFAGVGGVSHLSGYPDMPPLEYTSWPDVEVGTWGAFAVLSALHERARTGKGTYIDLSGNEVFTWYIGEALLEYAMNGRSPGPLGNRHPAMAPHGCYRCAGDERWISIAVGNEDEWQALRGAMGDPEWAGDSRFATLSARLLQQDDLDRHIGEWTSQCDARTLAEQLQAAGVAAIPTFSAVELYESQHLQARAAFQTIVHPLHGPRTMVGPPWRFSRTEATIGGPGPMLGQHNEQVFGTLIGMTAAEIADLAERGALR